MAEHKIPAGIIRVSKGLYHTLDRRYEIRQDGKVWEVLEQATGHQVGGQFASRGLAVKSLADAGLLPTEAPRVQATSEQPEAARPDPTPAAQKPKRRSRAKAAA
jgi:hypothetical protein